jgi:long-chain acyl-CoA synthetase
MLSNENFTSALAAVELNGVKFFNDDVHISYLPLPHVMERLMVLVMMW